MGRLFWKFFFFFMLAQLTTVVGVSLVIWLRYGDNLTRLDFVPGNATMRLLDGASATLQYGGEAALRNLLQDWRLEPGPTFYAVGPGGNEILGRQVPQLSDVAPTTERSVPPLITRRVKFGDDQSYLLVAADPGPEATASRHVTGAPRNVGGAGPAVLPMEPIAGGVLASLAVAALLAWYVSKPIRSLRKAFGAAARGDFDARVGDSMGRRRDELADLGRDFDHTAARIKLLVDGQRRLLHDVSHELRSPLARLQAAVGLARQQPGNVKLSMDRIEYESVRMDKLVDELLTLSRVEAGMGAARDESVDLVELVNEVVRDANFEVGASSASIVFDIDLGELRGAHIKGNAEMLHRAFENVVRNAARHSPPGARVHVAGWRDQEAPEMHLVIADEGSGVPETEVESIFEPFFRGVAARGTRGHGLGLAIARRVIEAHGGSIRASNRTSDGLAVEIRLPI